MGSGRCLPNRFFFFRCLDASPRCSLPNRFFFFCCFDARPQCSLPNQFFFSQIDFSSSVSQPRPTMQSSEDTSDPSSMKKTKSSRIQGTSSGVAGHHTSTWSRLADRGISTSPRSCTIVEVSHCAPSPFADTFSSTARGGRQRNNRRDNQCRSVSCIRRSINRFCRTILIF
jgi:hypothetical protein